MTRRDANGSRQYTRHRPRRHATLLGAVLAALGVLVAAVCTPTVAAAANHLAANHLAAAATPSETTATSQLTTTPCSGLGLAAGVIAQCGALTVPLDRAHPADDTTQVAFTVIRHRDASQLSLGTIAYNPGGPGLTVVEQAGAVAQKFGPLLGRRDLLLFDLRGSGMSDQMTCPDLSAPLAFGPASTLYTAIGACGRAQGSRAADYGTDAIAEDLDALRAALGIGELDVWGESYGSYLAQVYAALFPSHVRSLVLSGPLPIDFAPWGVAQAAAARNSIGLVCTRNGNACQSSTVLTELNRLGTLLNQQPVHFTAILGAQQIPTVLDENALASIVFSAGSSPDVYGRLPSALTSALIGDYAPLEQLDTDTSSTSAYLLQASPAADLLANTTLLYATSCHDYPRVFSYADPLPTRKAAYQHALDALDPTAFHPFTPTAWTQSGVVGTGDCIDWPDEPTTSSPLPPGARMPNVPTLVLAGDMDGVTPISFGRQVAAEFPDSTFVTIPNIGHVPTQGDPCAMNLGLTFISTLTAGARTCAGTGTPPPVTPVQPLRAAGIAAVSGTGTLADRQAVGLILAMATDLVNQSGILQFWGSAAGLRGGTYTENPDGSVTLHSVQLVHDAKIDGTVVPDTSGDGGTGTLTLSGPGIADGTLSVTLTTQGHGHAVGTLDGSPADVVF